MRRLEKTNWENGMSTIEEDLDDIFMYVKEWKVLGLSRADQIIEVLREIKEKMKILADENNALLRALEHLVSEERT